jgi:hypothetical protein
MMVSSDKSSVIKDVSIGGRQGEGIEGVLGGFSGELEGSGFVIGGLGSGRWIDELLLPCNFVRSGRKRC